MEKANWNVENNESLWNISSKARRKYSEYNYEAQSLLRNGYEERIQRRSTGLAARCFFLCFITLALLFLMYIPVYNRASQNMAIVQGWSLHTSRDTKTYVQPQNITIIHRPLNVCTSTGNPLFVLIIVTSSTKNFYQRDTIRKTWANYDNHIKIDDAVHIVESNNVNYIPDMDLKVNETKKNISKRYLDKLIENLASAMKDVKVTHETQEKRFNDDNIDVKTEVSDPLEMNYNDVDYEYVSNVMKIPQNGLEDTPNLKDVIEGLKKSDLFKTVSTNKVETNGAKEKIEVTVDDVKVDRRYRVLFLLGRPADDSELEVQKRIDEEAMKYGDIIQEDFIDVYSNLTLKSVMLLKWVVNNCNEKVRYIMKTDDDMFLNTPNLMRALENRSAKYMLIGDLIAGARPVADSRDKWYSPRYMYGGRVYPKYLSGTGYVLSYATAVALYQSALRTPLFHLEDIYITGICSARATPRQIPTDVPGFVYNRVHKYNVCDIYPIITAHRVPHYAMPGLVTELSDVDVIDRCEKERIRSKMLSMSKSKRDRFNILKFIS